MVEGVKQVDPREPAVGPHEGAAAEPVGRDARHVAAVIELGADEVVLCLDAGPAVADGEEIELRGDRSAAEGGVGLRVDDLAQLVASAAGGKVVVAAIAGVRAGR
ncbi:hypothetical protein FHR71_002474 [Methylobacterium sp. RAS18]|nr:hypothetical protein [Methylobacterium sp. RAS18]